MVLFHFNSIRLVWLQLFPSIVTGINIDIKNKVNLHQHAAFAVEMKATDRKLWIIFKANEILGILLIIHHDVFH